MDVIPLDASLVKGSHGRLTDDPRAGPLFITSEPGLLPDGRSPPPRSRLSCSTTCSDADAPSPAVCPVDARSGAMDDRAVPDYEGLAAILA